MAQYKASIIFSLKDLFSGPSQKIKASIQGLDGQANKTKKTFSDFWNSFNNNSEQSQTAANLALASQAFSATAQQLNTLINAPRQVATAFESGMARVSTVLTSTNAIGGNTTATLDTITTAARNMASGVSNAGKTASIGMDTFTNSVYTMLSSGLQTTQAIAATEQAALLAKATGGTMADAASALTGIFNNLGNKSADAQQEMTRLSDIVAGTQNYFAFENLSQFTDGLKNVSGIANSAGVPLTQLSAAIGQLNTNMITGPEAGTALKTVIAQLGKASKTLGFDIASTSDGGLDLITTFQNIQAIGLNTDSLIKGFGTEAGPAVALLTSNLDALKSGFNAVENASGTTLQNASKMADTFATKQEKLNNAWQVFQQRIGTGSVAVASLGTSIALAGTQTLNLISSIPILGEGLTAITGGIAQTTGGILSFVASSFQFTAGLNSMFALGSKMPDMWGMLNKGFGKLKTRLLTAIPTMWGYITSAWAAVAANWSLLWPILAVVGAVTLVIAGFKNWLGIGDFFKKVWESITIALTTSWQWIQKTALAFWDFIQPIAKIMLYLNPLTAIPSLIIQHWQPIKTFFQDLFGHLGTLFETFGGWASKLFGGKSKITTPNIEIDGTRATGGPVQSGKTYLVGEQGAELFRPTTSGTIVPNSQLTQTATPPSTSTNITIENIHIPTPKDLQHFVALLQQFTQELGHANN